MKITKLPFLALALCFLFACSKKEEMPTPKVNSPTTQQEVPKPNNELKGNWQVTDISYAGTSVTSMPGYEASANFTGTGYDLTLTIKFDENPNNYTSNGDYSIRLTTNYNGQSIIQNWPNQSFIYGGIWSKQGNELTVTSQANGIPQKATILELTSTTLKMGYNTTQVTEQNGTRVSVVVAGTYTFKRL